MPPLATMDPHSPTKVVFEVLTVLAAGLVSGAVCKRFGISMLVGYLLSGAALGLVFSHLVYQRTHELEYLAEVGVLLMLFAIGIEFSLAELVQLSRPFFVGGLSQMALVAAPVAIVGVAAGLTWQAALLVGMATAFSSTVLVFKTLEEWGQTATSHGRRAMAILLFQDVSIVPLVLLMPLLTGHPQASGIKAIATLAIKGIGFLGAIPLGRQLVIRYAVPWLSQTRSVELLVLFSVVVLGSAALIADRLGLPPMVGAFGAGLMLNGNRLTRQINSVLLPFRETFAAVFFVSLGTLIRFDALLAIPALCASVLVATVALKAAAATAALRLTGLGWRGAFATGVGLAQIGEFAFILLLAGQSQSVLPPNVYNLMIFVAVITLTITPQFLNVGLRLAQRYAVVEHELAIRPISDPERMRRAMIVGIGPVGAQIASQLEIEGYDVCLVDLSPVNLHRFAQQGFRTVVGDGAEPAVLARADAEHSSLITVAVPDDASALRIVSAIRQINSTATVLVRCRFQLNAARLRSAGSTDVFSEEREVASRISKWLAEVIRWSAPR